MADRVPAPRESRDALVDQVDDLLEDIDHAIHPPSVHPLGHRHEAPEEEEVDPLEELSIALKEDSDPVITTTFVDDDDEDEITREWHSPTMREFAQVYALPSDAGASGEDRASLPWIGEDDMDERTPGTLRPSAVSFAPAPVARSARAQTGRSWRDALGERARAVFSQKHFLAIAAAAAVVAAVVAYGVGPYSVDRVSAAPGVVSRQEPLHRHEPEAIPSHAVRQAVTDQAAVSQTRRIVFSVDPSNAYVSLRRVDQSEERRSGGPWPRALDLEPGDYEMVVFRAGYRAVLRRITVNESTPDAMDIQLRVEDIYE